MKTVRQVSGIISSAANVLPIPTRDITTHYFLLDYFRTVPDKRKPEQGNVIFSGDSIYFEQCSTVHQLLETPVQASCLSVPTENHQSNITIFCSLFLHSYSLLIIFKSIGSDAFQWNM
ncbi:hypothetical protein TNIN_3891 [Trichonephila inaurata madagascariensis]|uniref:Uncharacterized protein n=1 Tax=Trichonephila inaurata madagascariensis TaxID=2747483 RepID=A0A8X6XZI6_9ARAC|nr:hypothetical protein TNIN_3891 [Trichonephila inaurata madagascariensis]